MLRNFGSENVKFVDLILVSNDYYSLLSRFGLIPGTGLRHLVVYCLDLLINYKLAHRPLRQRNFYIIFEDVSSPQPI